MEEIIEKFSRIVLDNSDLIVTEKDKIIIREKLDKHRGCVDNLVIGWLGAIMNSNIALYCNKCEEVIYTDKDVYNLNKS